MLTMPVLHTQNSDYAYDASFAYAKLLGGTYIAFDPNRLTNRPDVFCIGVAA
jgi:hypothetical protein